MKTPLFSDSRILPFSDPAGEPSSLHLPIGGASFGLIFLHRTCSCGGCGGWCRPVSVCLSIFLCVWTFLLLLLWWRWQGIFPALPPFLYVGLATTCKCRLLLGISAPLLTLLGLLFLCRLVPRSSHLPHRVPHSPHLPHRVPHSPHLPHLVPCSPQLPCHLPRFFHLPRRVHCFPLLHLTQIMVPPDFLA